MTTASAAMSPLHGSSKAQGCDRRSLPPSRRHPVYRISFKPRCSPSPPMAPAFRLRLPGVGSCARACSSPPMGGTRRCATRPASRPCAGAIRRSASSPRWRTSARMRGAPSSISFPAVRSPSCRSVATAAASPGAKRRTARWRSCKLDDAGFLAEIEQRFGYRLGALTLAGPRASWPLEFLMARA